MRASVAVVLMILYGSASAGDLSDAFSAGSQFARDGNGAAHGTINSQTTATVPNFSATPTERSWFGSTGLSEAATTRTAECAEASGDDPTCDAVRFSQTNPTRRPGFELSPSDPLLTRGKTIADDPESLAGQIAGSYSDCTVETTSTPEVLETGRCHQRRTVDSLTCERLLVVTPVETAGCSPGQFLTRVITDPCPNCPDYVAHDFSCGLDDYVMHTFTLWKGVQTLFQDLGTIHVPGQPGIAIPETPALGRFDGINCYQTYYSQSCTREACTIGVRFTNPCQGTNHFGTSTFNPPRTVTFTDTWDNRCAPLEARAAP